MSAWIPALHAGMTHGEILLIVTEAPPVHIFTGRTEFAEMCLFTKNSLLRVRSLA